MEVALGRAIKGWVFWILSTVVILDVLKSLPEVFVMIRIAPICLKDDVREQSCKLAFADFCLSQPKAGIVFATEFGIESNSDHKCLVVVHFIMDREQMLEILLTKDLHE